MRWLRITFWLLTAAYWVVLAVLTHLPPSDLPHVEIDDKTQHFLSYGLLAGLLAMALWVTFPRRRWMVWAVFGVGVIYGAIDEQTQKLVGRTCDFDDWVADAVGTMAGVLPVIILQRFVRPPAAEGPRPQKVRAVVMHDALDPELEAALETVEGDAHPGPSGPTPYSRNGNGTAGHRSARRAR